MTKIAAPYPQALATPIHLHSESSRWMWTSLILKGVVEDGVGWVGRQKIFLRFGWVARVDDMMLSSTASGLFWPCEPVFLTLILLVLPCNN